MEETYIIELLIEGNLPPGLAEMIPQENPDDDWNDPEFLLDMLNTTDSERMMFRDRCQEKEAELEALKRDREALARSIEIVTENGDRVETRRFDSPCLWTKHDVATFLGLSPKTIDELVRTRKLACVQLDSKNRRFKEEHIEEFLRGRTIEGPKPIDDRDRSKVKRPERTRGGKTESIGETDEAQLREEMRSWL